jgi:hypothetical protein
LEAGNHQDDAHGDAQADDEGLLVNSAFHAPILA